MRKKKRAITLLEIMIVIFLIGLIGGVVGYNMKGSLDKGKAFKSREGAAKIENILTLQIAQDWDPASLQTQDNIRKCLQESRMVKDVDKLLKDGWGSPYDIKVDQDGTVTVTSPKLEEYDKKKTEQPAAASSNG